MQKGEQKASAGRLAALIVEATKRIAGENGKNGLLFSGGLDSATIGLALKKAAVPFTCYSAFVDFGKGKFGFDEGKTREAARKLHFGLKAKAVSLEELEGALPEIISITGLHDAVSTGVAATIFFACKAAAEGKARAVFSGMAADELFAGYHRSRNAEDIEKECHAAFEKMLAVDLKRDARIARHFGLEAKAQLLDKRIVKFAFSLPPKEKVVNRTGKIVLRRAALLLGMPKELAFAPKKAAQYSSGMDKAIGLLAKSHGFKSKGAYLASLASIKAQGL